MALISIPMRKLQGLGFINKSDNGTPMDKKLERDMGTGIIQRVM